MLDRGRPGGAVAALRLSSAGRRRGNPLPPPRAAGREHTVTPSAPRRFRTDRNVRLLYTLGALTQFQPGLAIWVVYLLDFRHLSLAQVGLMEAFFWGVKVLVEVPAGAVADRFGRRAAFALGLVIEASGVVLFAFASSYPLLLLSYVLWSGGFSFRSGNDHAYLYDALAAEARTLEFTARAGVYQACTTLAFTASGIAGAWLAARTTLQLPFLLGAVPYSIALGVLLLMREPPRGVSALGRLGYRQTLGAALHALRASRVVCYALLFEIALTTALVPVILLQQPFLQRQGVPLALFGLLQAPASLAGVAGAVLSARVARAAGTLPLALGTLATTAGGLALLAAVDHPAAFAGFVAIHAALGLATPALAAYVNDRTDSAIRATIMSVVPLGTAITFAITGPFAGVAGDASLRLAFAGMAAVIALTAGACYALWLRADAERASGPLARGAGEGWG
ncbi:MAG: MFS transporter [Dehalococcoidia bacterium]|nr:MFS transporter [Dehalococcoidia bacterium]